MIDGTHGQTELGDAVAAEDVQVVVVQRVGARLCEQRVKAVFVVRLAGAGLPAEHHVVRRVHRHLEVHGAVAAVNGLQVLRQNGRLRGRELESVVVVAFAQTKGDGYVGDGGFVDGEVQHGGAVAAVHIRDGVLIVLGFNGLRDGEVVFVVVGVLANVRGDFAAFLGTHIQMQVDDAVAAVHGRQCRGVITCLIEHLAVEIILAVEADGVADLGLEHRVYGQGEDGETVAAVNVLVEVGQGIFAGFIIACFEAVLLVNCILAGLVDEVHLAGRVDRDVQGDEAVAAEDGLQTLGHREVAGLRGGEFEVVFGIDAAEAERGFKRRGGGLVDGEMQDGETVATVHVGARQLVILALHGFGDVKAVFVVGFAGTDFSVEIFDFLRIEGEVQRDGAVAAVGGRQVGGVVAFLADFLAIEYESAVLTDGLVEFRLENGQDRQMERGGAVAAIDGLSFARQRLLAGFQEKFVEAVVRVFTADAHLVVQLHVGGLVDGQVHRDNAVAVLRGGEALGVIAGFGVGLAVPFVFHASGNLDFLLVSGIDGQVQRDDAVAAVDVRELLRVVAGLDVHYLVPCVGFAGRGVKFGRAGRVDGQRQRHDTVATVRGGEGLCVNT